MYLLFAIFVAFKGLILTVFLSILLFLLRKQINPKIFLGLFLISFIVLIPLNLEEYFSPYPYIATGYLAGFSRESFQKIKAGMGKDEVEQLIGEGFKDRFIVMPKDGEKTCILYSFDKDPLLTDFAWIGTSVCYNDQEKVTRIIEVPIRD